MAALTPELTKYVDTNDKFRFGVHKVILSGSSDTVEVSDLILNSSGTVVSTSVVELDDGNNSTGATIAATNKNRVTITGGSNGGVFWFMTMHLKNVNVNWGDESVATEF